MSTKEQTLTMIEMLNEEQLKAVNLILQGIVSLNSEIPNKETIEAMQEMEDIINGKIPAKRYATVREMFNDIMSEGGDEWD